MPRSQFVLSICRTIVVYFQQVPGFARIKNNLFVILLSSLSGGPFDLPPMRRLAPTSGSE
jgi:hypothetical protein